ncbi:MAG: hypothetical protein QOD76_986 [Solirubrobacteraceae bacterium]|nr:hypothetical protein [Solirubrobacteraceae bacterium]
MRSAPRLTLILCSLALCLGAGLAPVARGDGDPASDILLYQNGYLPYGQVIPAQLEANVQQVITNASEANFHVKVAIIAAQGDLGSVPSMFGQPQQYARFLGKELAVGPTTNRAHAPGVLERGRAAAKVAARSPLLVVMPNGYGVAGPVSADARKTVERTKLNVQDGISLGQAAVDGIVKLAGASGHQVSAPPSPLADTPSADSGATPLPVAPARGRSSGGGTPWALICIGAGAVALLSMAAVAWRRRRARARAVG